MSLEITYSFFISSMRNLSSRQFFFSAFLSASASASRRLSSCRLRYQNVASSRSRICSLARCCFNSIRNSRSLSKFSSRNSLQPTKVSSWLMSVSRMASFCPAEWRQWPWQLHSSSKQNWACHPRSHYWKNYPASALYLGHVTVTHLRSGPWFNIKMSSYPYRKSHCGDKTILWPW